MKHLRIKDGKFKKIRVFFKPKKPVTVYRCTVRFSQSLSSELFVRPDTGPLGTVARPRLFREKYKIRKGNLIKKGKKTSFNEFPGINEKKKGASC